jgi:hypothetical protein
VDTDPFYTQNAYTHARAEQLQDHGARERALMESKAELQKRLFESMIKPKVKNK